MAVVPVHVLVQSMPATFVELKDVRTYDAERLVQELRLRMLGVASPLLPPVARCLVRLAP